MKRNIVTACVFVLFTGYGTMAQQMFTFTQYTNNLTPIATSYSLLDRAPSVSLLTRRQWVGIEGAPKTSVLTGSLPLSNINASAGIFLVQDEVAVEKRTEVNLFFAKAVQLNEHNYLSLSVNGGVSTYDAAYSTLDPFDQSYRDDIRETTGIIGFSLMLYDPGKYYVGVSLPRADVSAIGSDSTSYHQRNWKGTWFISGAYLQPLNEIFIFKPALLLSHSKDQRTQADVSATFYWREQLGLGVNYRTSHEVAGMLSYTYQHRIMLCYSYQLAGKADEISGLSDGSHEIMLRYRFGKDLVPKLL